MCCKFTKERTLLLNRIHVPTKRRQQSIRVHKFLNARNETDASEMFHSENCRV